MECMSREKSVVWFGRLKGAQVELRGKERVEMDGKRMGEKGKG